MNSISLGILSQVAAVFTRILAIGIYSIAYENLSLMRLSESSAIIWTLALISYDFCYYWLHRFGHEFSILWAAHVVHHQSEEYNLSTALRQTSTGTFLGWIFYLPLAVIGIPPTVFAGVAMIDLLYQFWIHTQLIGRLGWFDHIFASPSNHRVHHAVNNKYLDKNYGGIFIIWDKLFGTFAEEDTREPPVYGTRSQLKSWNPLWANLEVYSALFLDALHTKSATNKIRVLFSKTGWRPDDVEQRYPKESFNLDRPKFAPKASKSSRIYCACQFVLILLTAIHFLQVQKNSASGELSLYAFWILASLVSLGLVMESKAIGYFVELIRCNLTGLLVIIWGEWFLTGPLETFSIVLIVFWTLSSSTSIAKIASGDMSYGNIGASLLR